QRLERSAGRAYRLSIEKPGVLDQLFLRLCERRPPAAGEVEIAVDAAGLNFKDVMTAMGIYPGAQSLMLGGECVGRIVAVGEGVRDLQVGQEVVAVTPGSFATHVTVAVSRVTARPASLDPIQAAALPIAYMTAWYGLVHLAHLQPGERVLIHSATGGTGLAAVHIARYLGAEVFATAGTEGKREWLRAQGVRLVMDSRALDFSAQVLAATAGAGVDVVLNSLSGPAIEASFAALGQDGRFIELSKTDIYSDRPLGLLPFRRSLSYSAVDLAALSENRPERFGRLLREVMDLISASRLPTLPIETVPITRAADAFRKMAQAQHIGKLVLTLSESDALVRSQPRTEVPIRSHGSYLITGGLGALGLKVAQWLGDRGAGHLVLMGRAGDLSFEQRIAVSGLVAKGTRVSIAKGDVANRAQLEQILADIQGSGMPLCGIVHAAGALDDGLIMQQTPLRFRTVMGPKLQGAWHLHELTRHKPLDFFVMYSSAAGLLGSAGQANYAAANTFLDALAHHRHALGLPALSVDWGAFSEVGLATEQENRGARLATRGIDSLTPDQGIAALDRLLQNEVAQMGVVPLDVQRWGEFYRAVATSRRLSRLHSELPKELRSEGGVQELRVRLLAAEPKVRGALLAEVLLAQVAQVLRLAENQIAVTVPLSSLGMDSLMGLELRNRIESVLGIRVPASLLWTHPTVAVLSDYLQRALVPDERASGRTKERGKSLPFFGPAASEPGSLSASAMAAGPTRGSALVRLHSASTPKLHLVCFPPGGGGPELFQRFTTKLPLLVNISAVHLPGRSARLTEPPYGDMRQVLSGIRDELLSVCKSEIPVAFVGHSFGSVLAFEAAHDLANKGLAHPIHLFVSACASPRRGSELERYLGQGRQDASGKFSSDTLSDGELLELLRRAGALGRGAEKLDDDELAAFFIPTLRADLRVLRTYVHEDKRVVPIPITAIIGRQDPMIDADRIMEWMGHTSDSFAARIICADHGIRYEHMWSVISSQLAPLLDVPLDP
ncbi:MAG TPA: SDR family NAD(P)-dependent oxidoreductase, partial [Pseudomonadota bacterium]|nr:SDR family NAD(P)-dependent oxidoreductase [Pseudomonadota bacterium]